MNARHLRHLSKLTFFFYLFSLSRKRTGQRVSHHHCHLRQISGCVPRTICFVKFQGIYWDSPNTAQSTQPQKCYTNRWKKTIKAIVSYCNRNINQHGGTISVLANVIFDGRTRLLLSLYCYISIARFTKYNGGVHNMDSFCKALSVLRFT